MTAIMSGRVLFAATLLFGAVVLLVMAWSLGRIAGGMTESCGSAV